VNQYLQSRGSSPLSTPQSAAQLLKRPELMYEDILLLLSEEDVLQTEVSAQVQTEVKYKGYIDKQLLQIEKFQKMENRRIPEDLSYQALAGLSREAMEKLGKIRPVSVGQASRISGVSPADISLLLIYLEQQRRKGGAGIVAGN
jgi:tRNA uridine 5-carboxymethylaminomethyl modification enzyme